MKTKIIGAIVGIMLIFLGMFVLSGCIENGIPSPIVTFSCNPQMPANIHLMNGDCEDPVSWVHIYDLGEVKRLVRITGTVEHKKGDAVGEGGILFFMCKELPCPGGDIWWIRVRATYNRQVSFDEYADVDMPPNQEYKLSGRYLIISSSITDHQMVFSEGTAYFLN